MKNLVLKKYIKTIGKIKKKMLQNKDFTIISNNCWGGIIYRDFNLPYNSPTVGLFFMAEDYIKFIYNLKSYINEDLNFISLEDSKYKNFLKKLNYSNPIGKIKDIEIMFLHYTSEEEAKEKWNRRKKRINWNNIIYKFSDQNMCTYEHIEKFNNFNVKNKICFTTRKYNNINSIQIKKYKNCENVVNDIKYYKRYFKFIRYVNEINKK